MRVHFVSFCQTADKNKTQVATEHTDTDAQQEVTIKPTQSSNKTTKILQFLLKKTFFIPLNTNNMFLVLPLLLISSVYPAPPPPPLYPPRPNMTGAGCSGPVQSYPASWPNSHYYQGGGTSRYLLFIYYHKR